MSRITVTISGMQAGLENVNITESQLTKKVSAEIQYAGFECQKLAKQACPVDKGRLRASIQYQKIDMYSCQVTTNVNYSKYVEFGTVHMRARPFLMPAYVTANMHLMDALRNI